MAKKTKKTGTTAEVKKDLIDDMSIVATTVFDLKKIEMKDDLQWRIKLELKTQLPQSFREYTLKFSLNEEPFNVRINDLERRKQEIESSAELFEEGKNTQVKNIDAEIKEIEGEIEDMRVNCPDIEFTGTIEELKYKDGNTIIVVLFPSPSVQELNEKRRDLQHYKIELIRE